MKFFIKSILRFGAVTLVLSSIALLPIPGCKESANLDDRQEAVWQKPADSDVPDGFYLVSRQSERRAELLPVGEDERIVIFDKTYGGLGADEPPIYLVVSKSPQVPISLSSPPKSGEVEDGKKAVMLDFSEEVAAKLERFSADNIGGKVAVIVGGKVATRHKIRAAISGGKLQISCCGAGACEHLMSELSDNYSEEK